MQHCVGTADFWLVSILTAVVSVIPRLCGRIIECTIWPNSVTKAMLMRKAIMTLQAREKGLNKSPRGLDSGQNYGTAFTSTASESLASVRNRGGSQDTEMTTIIP